MSPLTFDPDHSLPDRFRSAAQRHPTALAIQDECASLSYFELDRQTNAVANSILHYGPALGIRIVLLLDQSVHAGIATLGVLKCGAAYVPLDPLQPPASLRNIIAVTGAAFVITHRRYRSISSELAVPGCEVLDIEDLIAAPDTTAPDISIPPDALAYIYFTSGSTGTPKGVCDTHRNVAHNVWRYTHHLNIDHGDRLSLLQAPHFSGAVSSFFCAVLNGAACFPFNVHRDGLAAIPAWLRTNRITIFHGVPAIFREVITTGGFADLRCVRLEGDQATRRDIELFRKHCAPGTVLANGLGATECGLVRQWRIDATTEIPEGPLPIGTPVVDMTVLLLGDDGTAVPNGETGEIAIRSHYLASGYWQQPELTAKKFLAAPDDTHARIYLTGDRGRMLRGDLLQFLGRTNSETKLHGRWVDLEVIERAVQDAPGVRESVVMMREDDSGTARIVAYIVRSGLSPATIGNLRAQVSTKVPASIVPSHWVFLDALPLTRNLKVDRAALLAPDWTSDVAREEFVAPSTEQELALARIWCEVLRVPSVGLNDNFFSLGGDSLLAMQVVARLQRTLNQELPLQGFFENPTIGLLAPLLRAGADSNASDTGNGHTSCDQPIPLSFAQQRLWFIHRFAESSVEYHVCDAVRLRGPLDRILLQRALDAIVVRHGSLRTRFEERDGEPAQIVASCCPAQLHIEDLSGIPADARPGAIATSISRLRNVPFDLSNGPLLRVQLCVLGPGDHILARVWHHLITDGWSTGVFNRELSLHYSALSRGSGAELNPVPQYADLAVAQRRRGSDTSMELHLAYWRNQLREVPHLELPTDFSRPAVQTFAGAEHTFAFPPKLGEQLRAFGARENVTPFMTLFAAFQILLSRYTGQDDIVVGTPAANRTRAEWEHVIGLFVNPLVLRTDLSGRPTFREAVLRVRQLTLAAFEHQDLPFERLTEELKPNRDLSRSPLIQVIFAMQPAPTAALELPGVRIERYAVPAEFTHYDLELNLWLENGEWFAAFVYNATLFRASTIERMSGHYLTLLDSLLGKPDRPFDNVEMLTAAERLFLVQTCNQTFLQFAGCECIHHLFEQQAKRVPDAIAVGFGDASLTYRELDTRADGFARRLRTDGVTPGTFVGLCLERSLEMIVGMLAILKAGGAYVPIDPYSPPDRARMILDDARAPVLVTQRTLSALSTGFTGTTVWLDDDLTPESSDGITSVISPDVAAYAIYTSGSTGRPKGVVVEHCSVVNLLRATGRSPGFRPDDVVVAVTTIAFDFSVLEIFLPLSIGARVVIASENERTSGADLLMLLQRSAATVLMATPVTWALLVNAGLDSPRLRAFTGGESLSTGLANELLARCGELWNVYGPTETTVYSLFTRVEPDKPITIGRPIANTTAHIVDRRDRLVPVGVPGELLIGGEGLARGYLDQPDATAQRFIPDCFSGIPGGRLYRTGDRCRRMEDGSIEFLGRNDDQVKIRGFRIELGEVEHALAQVPGVRECAVAVRESSSGEKMLVAYVVPSDPGVVVDLTVVQRFLRVKLPDYMVPLACVTLPALPLSRNQKLDRAALPSPSNISDPPSTTAPTQSFLELELTRLWRRSFQRDRIGRDENFFELGGHSLLAVRVMSELEKWVGRRLPVATLFHAPTIARLARVLSTEPALPSHHALVPLQPLGSSPPLFCVHGWGGDVFGFLEMARQFAPNRPVYGIRAVGLDDGRPRHTSVEEMALHYVAEIRSLQPAGPYHLIGHSAGGWIAFAIAKELKTAGAPVATLGLLDTEPLFQPPMALRAKLLLPFFFRRMRIHAQRVKPELRVQFIRYVIQKLHALRGHVIANPGKVSHPDYFASVVQRYRPTAYEGPITLFQGADSKDTLQSFWRHVARGHVKAFRVQGTHQSLLAPENAVSLVRVLSEVMTENESTAHAGTTKENLRADRD